MKRALTAVAPAPGLNFWRLVHGNQLDIAVLEWCKVFGSDGEATHWKNVVPEANRDLYRAELLASLQIDADTWTAYWQELKDYRDNLVAHHIEDRVANFPRLDLALTSSFFHYRYLLEKLRALGEQRYPDDLATYYVAFEEQARETAERATAATDGMEERVF
jgi:hypothetical protein